MSRPFHFKQFSIYQDHAAMKVGTDSVLLASWVSKDGVKSILDIGCGTGLLSLMMAQRYENASIIGVEIDSDAMIDAQFNSEKSKWGDRIQLIKANIMELDLDVSFDLIITNPPYFPYDTIAPKQKRAMARSGDKFSMIDWLKKIKSYLRACGKVAFILPIEQWESIEESVNDLGFYLVRVCYVKPNLQKTAHRVMIELQLEQTKGVATVEELIIETTERHKYTEEYKALTNSFYLDKD